MGLDGSWVANIGEDHARRAYLLHRMSEGKLTGNLRALHQDALAKEKGWRRYNRQAVDRVEGDLIAAIGEAKHVRNLKPEDHVIVRIVETSSQGDMDGRTVMNLRIKMSDVLSAADGGLDRNKVAVFRYVEH